MNRKTGQQPVANESTDNTDYNVTNNPEACTPNDFTGQPPGNETH
jgi:hypothetical protein